MTRDKNRDAIFLSVFLYYNDVNDKSRCHPVRKTSSFSLLDKGKGHPRTGHEGAERRRGIALLIL
jgi:hypothetical protein